MKNYFQKNASIMAAVAGLLLSLTHPSNAVRFGPMGGGGIEAKPVLSQNDLDELRTLIEKIETETYSLPVDIVRINKECTWSGSCSRVPTLSAFANERGAATGSHLDEAWNDACKLLNGQLPADKSSKTMAKIWVNLKASAKIVSLFRRDLDAILTANPSDEEIESLRDQTQQVSDRLVALILEIQTRYGKENLQAMTAQG